MNGLDLRALLVRFQTMRRYFGGTPKIYCKLCNLGENTCMIISFISRDEGVSSNDLSNDKMGRDPLRQFPDKLSSSLLSTFARTTPIRSVHYGQLNADDGHTIL
jgi:hypothetical protein